MTPQEKGRKAARELHLADCSHSSQWIYNPETRTDERCPCYVRMMAAVEAIGKLELPATPSREDALELGS